MVPLPNHENHQHKALSLDKVGEKKCATHLFEPISLNPHWMDRFASLIIGVLFLISPLAHTVALRNSLLGCLFIVILHGVCCRKIRVTFPAWYCLLAFLLWAFASCFWSVDVRESLGRFWADLFAPVMMGFACLIWGRNDKVFRFWMSMIACSLILLLILFLPYSFDFSPTISAWWHLEPDAGWPRGRPYYFYGIGEGATYATYIIPLIFVLARTPLVGAKLLAFFVLIIVCCVHALIMSRTAIMLAGLTASGLAIVWLWQSLKRYGCFQKMLVIAVLSCTAIVLSFGLLEWVSSVRLNQTNLSQTVGKSAIQNFAQHDVRPAMWKVYIQGVYKHPIGGVGFGRSLVARVYAKNIPEALYQLDHNTRSHAHNYLLNLALECGLVGLGLFLLWWIASIWQILRYTRSCSRYQKHIGIAAIALLLLIFVRNLTDDFALYNVALCSFGWLGLLIARLSSQHTQQ